MENSLHNTGKKILIVDDSPLMRFQLKDIISELGCTVIGEASNGKEAIRKNKELKPDIITMDIIMPEMNGVEAIDYIRKSSPDVKIVMITTVTTRRMIKESIHRGACDYIVKPFQPKKVAQVIMRLVGKQ